ncbi:DUF983 domain-containing protein [Siccirubricoccus sp. KC 17139]|uniref:DUF983 domain-containing protein n=1 Tax=Siccirubricoccus soli TaxID=2899147 RepID=A0ABT1D6R9_9PROT|nr:DUF983 domain-containing protein [Siccirubricoccus soli]MCO6417618.1 DUF983 domain-containing protein [Siccirubricoccus soli]MCP2683753.1 DUF983 domain-containing protein [Siccirubricoccus soli]
MSATGPAPLVPAALLGRCPRCGRGPIFIRVLEVREACPVCGLDLRAHDAGDGPAVAGIFVAGAVAVIAALFVDTKFSPPLWVHAVLWPALVLPLTLLVMRVAKAALVGLNYRHRPG